MPLPPDMAGSSLGFFPISAEVFDDRVFAQARDIEPCTWFEVFRDFASVSSPANGQGHRIVVGPYSGRDVMYYGPPNNGRLGGCVVPVAVAGKKDGHPPLFWQPEDTEQHQ